MKNIVIALLGMAFWAVSANAQATVTADYILKWQVTDPTTGVITRVNGVGMVTVSHVSACSPTASTVVVDATAPFDTTGTAKATVTFQPAVQYSVVVTSTNPVTNVTYESNMPIIVPPKVIVDISSIIGVTMQVLIDAVTNNPVKGATYLTIRGT